MQVEIKKYNARIEIIQMISGICERSSRMRYMSIIKIGSNLVSSYKNFISGVSFYLSSINQCLEMYNNKRSNISGLSRVAMNAEAFNFLDLLEIKNIDSF